MQASVLYFALCCAEYAIEYRVFVVVLRKMVFFACFRAFLKNVIPCTALCVRASRNLVFQRDSVASLFFNR